MAQISVRTLHHYDQIGLLKPAQRSDKGYRIYGQEQLLLLQQVLFYRQMDIPLKEIKQIINDPDFDILKALEFHKEQLVKRAEQLHKLLVTVDKTIENLKNSEKMISDKELYSGFKPEEVEQIKEEVIQRWGKESLEKAEGRIREKGRKGWKKHQETDEEINQLMASMVGFDPADIRVQRVISRHFQQMNLYYEVNEERYRGLGELYVEDERFKQYYEKYGEGLAGFMQQAIEVFCNNNLQVIE